MEFWSSIAVAFVLGLGARGLGLPPLVGFLAAGFALHAFGVRASDELGVISDLGIQLLLFSIGLKLELRSLGRPQVWGVATLHMAIAVTVFGVAILGLGAAGLSAFAGLDATSALVLAFALSFSSTVFAVKILEEKGESQSLHGRISVGILIVQDIFAVVFLTASTGKIPSVWALALLGLPLLRPLLMGLMNRCGHGELLVLLALMLSLGSAELFQLVDLKPDLGPLVIGVLVGSHPKAKELAGILLGFKDLFLVGFFLKIGLSGAPSLETFGLAALLMLALPLKAGLFFALLTRLRLRARSSVLCTFTLANYSEFGLIVGSVGAANGWIGAEWLVVIAVALSVSFVLASPVNGSSHALYLRWADRLDPWERAERLPEEAPVSTGHAEIVVIGMGRVGSSAYDTLRERLGDVVIGIDSNPEQVREHEAVGRNVILGDATDPQFRARVERDPRVRMILLTMPTHSELLYVLESLKSEVPTMPVAVAAGYEDERAELEAAGADCAFNVLGEAGAGFAAHVCAALDVDGTAPA